MKGHPSQPLLTLHLLNRGTRRSAGDNTFLNMLRSDARKCATMAMHVLCCFPWIVRSLKRDGGSTSYDMQHVRFVLLVVCLLSTKAAGVWSSYTTHATDKWIDTIIEIIISYEHW